MTRPDPAELTEFHGMLTRSSKMRDFFALLTRVAATDSSVLIRGETGTGKELAARAIHDLSPRAAGPFRAVNCATFSPELLASELFGHVRGAFTGAVADRRGLFQVAHKGSLFLDEVAEIPLDIQARLLRVLQDHRFVPVGGTEPVSVDVRVISATHRALRRDVEEGRFRADLMYRLRVVPIFLPPLVERDGDVEALAWHFVDEFNRRPGGRRIQSISAQAMDAMLAWRWPGNIRELRNVIEHAWAVGEGPVLELAHLTPELRGEEPSDERTPPSVHSDERERLLEALRRSRGRKAEAAELLGMSRSTLWRKVREHGL